jgi:hypothetical protein
MKATGWLEQFADQLEEMDEDWDREREVPALSSDDSAKAQRNLRRIANALHGQLDIELGE